MSSDGKYTWKPTHANILPPPNLVELMIAVPKLLIFMLFTIVIMIVLIPILGFSLQKQKLQIFKFWAKCALFMCSLRLCVSGQGIRSGLIISNHISWIDILAILSISPGIFVAKSEVKRWFVVGFLAKLTNTIFVERRPSKILEQLNLLGRHLSEGSLIILFPESTSSDGQRILPFKSGLLEAAFHNIRDYSCDLKVQPLTLYYQVEHNTDKDLFAWYHSRKLLGHMLKVLAKVNKSKLYLTFDDAQDVHSFGNRKELSKSMFESILNNFSRHLGDAKN